MLNALADVENKHIFADVLHPYVAFAADNVTRMIGVMRLRQQRIQREPSECALPLSLCLVALWKDIHLKSGVLTLLPKPSTGGLELGQSALTKASPRPPSTRSRVCNECRCSVPRGRALQWPGPVLLR